MEVVVENVDDLGGKVKGERYGKVPPAMGLSKVGEQSVFLLGEFGSERRAMGSAVGFPLEKIVSR